MTLLDHFAAVGALVNYFSCIKLYNCFFFFVNILFNLFFSGISKCRKYGLEDDTIDFIGHALALHRDDNYLDEPAKDFVERVKVLIYKLSLQA